MIDLSIVIVNYNTRQLLADCLASLAAATTAPYAVETIVVDNASHDGSQAMVREQYPDLILVENEENVGFATANNIGVKKSSGAFVLFLNSDTRVDERALIEPLQYLQNNQQTGAITVYLEYTSGDRDPDNHRGFPTPWNAICHFSGLSKLFSHSPRFTGYFESTLDMHETHAVDVIAGSFMMMPRLLFDELGGWDEQYFFYGEDIDFCYRIRQADYAIIYYPHVRVVHYKGASSGLRKESAAIARPPKETRVRVARESVRAMKLFYKKFYRQQYPAAVTWFVLAGIQLRGWVRIIKHQLI